MKIKGKCWRGRQRSKWEQYVGEDLIQKEGRM
jgi:hypothetical protein